MKRTTHLLSLCLLCLLAGLAAACSHDDPAGLNGLNTGAPSNTVTLRATVDGGLHARAAGNNPAAPAVALPDGFMLRYVLEVWTTGDEPALVYREEKANATGEGEDFTFTLDDAGQYNTLLWADIINAWDAGPTETPYPGGTYLHYKDLLYTTTDNLKTVTLTALALDPYSGIGMTAPRTIFDAFCACHPISKLAPACNETVTLTRPLGQVNFIEKDTDVLDKLTMMYASYDVPAGYNVESGLPTEATARAEAMQFPILLGTGDFTANLIYVYAFAPADATQQTTLGNIALTFESGDSEINIAPLTVPAGIPVVRNRRTNISGYIATDINRVKYSVSVSPDWSMPDAEQGLPDPTQPDKMWFTIDLTDYSQDKTYTLPFATSGTVPADLTVDWGDGSPATTIPAGTDLGDGNTALDALITHTYREARRYTLMIASAQTDPAQQQMPDFKPGYYRVGTGNSNKLKLVLMYTPMLNMGQTSVEYCFSGCRNLASIPADLFARNTAATKFTSCFQSCTALTSIPAGLLAKNTEATAFLGCFASCEGLTSLPADLFAANTKATNFSSCFNGCTGLASVPERLFAMNTKATDFNTCFQGCAALTSLPAGLFVKNTEAKDFGNCFARCTGLASVPEGLFAANTKATDFTYCFTGCTKLVLNANIFCNEATEKETRFANQQMNFGSCFQDCGTDASIGVGRGGTAPRLWEYAMSEIGGRSFCFYNCTNLANYADIPPEWGGPNKTNH